MLYKNIFPAFFDRSSRFPGEESVDDLEERAHRAVKECIFPHLAEEDGFHIALASYGLCIGELVNALSSYDSKSNRNLKESYTGLMNTAWTRATISLDSPHQGPVDSNNPPPLSVKVTHIDKEDHTNLYKTDTDDVLDDETKMEALAFFGGAHTIYITVLHTTRHGEVNCDRTKTSAPRSDYSGKGIS